MQTRLLVTIAFGFCVSACGGDGGGLAPDGGAPSPVSDAAMMATDAAVPGIDSGGADPTDAGNSGGSGDAGGIDGSIASAAPLFSGLNFAYSDAPTQVVLRWLPAVDDETSPSQIRYLVFRGLAADALSATPVAEVTGATELTIDSLTADTDYYFQVVAQDGDGSRSQQHPAVAVSTIDSPLVVNNTPKDVAALGLTVVENGLNDFTLSGAGAASIVADDLLIINNSFGRTLRRVVSVTPAGADVNITTAKASLNEVFDGGSLQSSGVLVDPVGMAPARRRVTLWSRRPMTSQVPAVAHKATENTTVQTRVAGQPAALFHAPVSLDSGVTLEYGIGFQPSFKALAKYDSITNQLNRFRAVAKGTFSLDAMATYNLSAAAVVNVKKELFAKKYTFSYAVAGVPVIQDVELKLFAEAKFNFDGAIAATATLNAQKSLSFGFEWTRSNGFQLIKEQGFERTINYNLTGKAQAKGTLKIYPVISTTFYKVATAALSVTPTLTLDAKARLLPLPAEITKFDVTFHVGAQVTADITIFGLELLKYKSDEYRLIEIPIHSQPELTMRASTKTLDTCGKRKVYLQLADGYNNKVDLTTVQWSVEPAATITTGVNPLVVEFDAATSGTYTLTASANGDGFLGALGVRYGTLDITVVDAPIGDCDPVNSEGNPVLQCLANPLPGTGMFGAPTLNATMFAPGDTMELSLFACAAGCYFRGYMSKVDSTSNLSFIKNILLHDPNDLSIDDDPIGMGGSADAASTITFSLPAEVAPGAWEVGSLFFDGDFLAGQFYSHYSGNGSTYALSQYRQSGPAEFCDDAPTPWPALFFNVVGDDGRDGNDEPEEGVELAINGGKVVQTIAGIDQDWFQVAPTTEGSYGAGFDSDITYGTECHVTIAITNDTNATRKRCVYGTLADAQAKLNPLVCFDGPITFQTTAGQRYYVSVNGSAVERSYEIEAVSSCDDPLNAYARMTSSPQFSQNPVTVGAFVDITVGFTSNTTRLRVDLRNDNGSAGSTSNVTITPPATEGVAVYEMWKANLNNEYRTKVTLRDAGNETIYRDDPAVSTVNFAVSYYRADGFEILNLDSGIPLVYLQTN